MKKVENSFDSKQVLTVIERYSQALDLLDAYDHQNMTRPKGNEATYILTYEECRKRDDDQRCHELYEIIFYNIIYHLMSSEHIK